MGIIFYNNQGSVHSIKSSDVKASTTFLKESGYSIYCVIRI